MCLQMFNDIHVFTWVCQCSVLSSHVLLCPPLFLCSHCVSQCSRICRPVFRSFHVFLCPLVFRSVHVSVLLWGSVPTSVQVFYITSVRQFPRDLCVLVFMSLFGSTNIHHGLRVPLCSVVFTCSLTFSNVHLFTTVKRFSRVHKCSAVFM